MTSLLPSQASRTRSAGGRDPRRRRPLPAIALVGGVAAAGLTLGACLLLALLGWFLTDAGAHGAPRDALRTGALGWLLGHGSGVSVDAVRVTLVPLGITAAAAWTAWRVGHRVGDAVSGHGPDADGIADGQRDWTVPVAAGFFTGGYAMTALVTAVLAGSEDTAPAGGRVLLWGLVLGLGCGTPGLAIGSGRAAIWAGSVPPLLQGAAAVCRSLLRWWAGLCLLVLVVALVLDLGTALNILSQLRTDAGESALLGLLSLALLPNAVALSGAYLLGPGFTVGTGTLVAPTAVVLGPLPMFPPLAALPDSGPTPAWVAALMALPPLLAAAVTARTLARGRALRWFDLLLRGCLGGALAGVAFGAAAALAGGAVGPGRMRDVGPLVSDVLVHGVATFGIGGLLGALAAVAWQRRRRTSPRRPQPVAAPVEES